MQMNLIRFSGYINTLPSETFVHLSHDITFTFIRRFYPKRLTVHSDYKFFFYQYMCSLGIEPTTFALLTQCSNHWTTGTQTRWPITNSFALLLNKWYVHLIEGVLYIDTNMYTKSTHKYVNTKHKYLHYRASSFTVAFITVHHFIQLYPMSIMWQRISV